MLYSDERHEQALALTVEVRDGVQLQAVMTNSLPLFVGSAVEFELKLIDGLGRQFDGPLPFDVDWLYTNESIALNIHKVVRGDRTFLAGTLATPGTTLLKVRLPLSSPSPRHAFSHFEPTSPPNLMPALMFGPLTGVASGHRSGHSRAYRF